LPMGLHRERKEYERGKTMKNTWINTWGKQLKFPEDVFYSPELLWVKVEPENKLRLGISDLGVKAVKTLIYVRIKPRVGSRLNKGDLIGMVETSKMVWEIKAPVSGVVVDVNRKLLRGDPSSLVLDPYGEGWVLQLERTSETESELPHLLDGNKAKTKEWIAEHVEALVPLQPVT
jgi:glycine cleavage system H protein